MKKSSFTPRSHVFLLIVAWLNFAPTSRCASSESSQEYVSGSIESADSAELAGSGLGSFDLGSLGQESEADGEAGDIGHGGKKKGEANSDGVNTDFLREELELEEKERKVFAQPWISSALRAQGKIFGCSH